MRLPDLHTEQQTVTLHTFEELLNDQGYIIYTNVGDSMLPLLRQQKDIIEIKKKEGRVKKYEVALYKVDGGYVLHRCVSVEESGYVFAGDHNTYKEYGITDDMVLGVMTRVIRNGKNIYPSSLLYRIYAHFIVDFFSIKVFCVMCLKNAARITRITPYKLKRYLNWKIVYAIDFISDYLITGQNLIDSNVYTVHTQMQRSQPISINYLILKKVFSNISISPTDSIMVVGCGRGRVLAFLISQHCSCQLFGVETIEILERDANKWIKRYKNINVFLSDIYEVDYNQYSILFLNQSFSSNEFLCFLQLLEKQIHHEIKLICVFDYASDILLERRKGWKLNYRDSFFRVYGLQVVTDSITFSIWEYNPLMVI